MAVPPYTRLPRQSYLSRGSGTLLIRAVIVAHTWK